MNRKMSWLYALITAVAVIAAAFAIILPVVTDDKGASDKHFNNETSTQVTEAEEIEVYRYVLRHEEGALRIYRYIADDGQELFYDYADIDIGLLPDNLRERLDEGIYFDGEKKLYDFLQTYSS